MGAVFKSIGVRLFVSIFGTIVLVFVAFAFYSIQLTSNDLMSVVDRNSERTSSMIERAIHYGMLLNRKDDVHTTLQNIASGPGISAIRIYDKNGTIIFSTTEGEQGHRVDTKAEACVACHDSDKALSAIPEKHRSRLFRDSDGVLTLGRIQPIQNSPACSTAPCHAHPPSQSVLGVLDLKMPVGFIEDRRAESETSTLLAALLMALLGGLVTALLINRFVRGPVRRLAEGTRRIAAGDLSERVDVTTGDEIGELACAFNVMTDYLSAAERQKQQWEAELERKVEKKTAELGMAQKQLSHMEKMASLGKLAATVAHELNNPLAGILVYAKLVARELNELPNGAADNKEVLRYLEVISQETSRCGDIVRNLLSFARQQEGQLSEQRLSQVVERALLIVHHHLELANITLEQELSDEDELVCDPGQIQQALVALLVNAVEAMPDGGELTVHMEGDAETIEVSVRDTGVGIPEDVRPHIFEPFVSTKGDTKGVGLGLAVVYGIVHRHGGNITVESEVGRGTRFRILLPRDPAFAFDRDAQASVASTPKPSLAQPLSSDGVS